MPTQSPISQIRSDAPEITTVKLFKSFHDGYGDADDVHYTKSSDASTSIRGTSIRYNRIHGSVDARWPGQLKFGLKVEKVASPAHDLNPVFAISWTDTNGIDPAIFYLVGKKIMKVKFGATTEVGTNALGSSDVTGGMFDDDGSSVPYLYASFGAVSSSAKIRRMNRAQTVTTSSDVFAGLLLSLNGKAYRTVQATNGLAASQVSVCPYGSDRFTLASWGTATTVGYAGTDINVLVAVRQAPVCVKPEGIFAYNAGLDQWVNYTPSWRTFMHLRNGIGSFFLGDNLVIPMGDGGSVIFDGNNVRPFDPGGLFATPNLHTTRDNFEAGTMSAIRHWIVGVTGVPSKLISAGSSMLAQYHTAIGDSYANIAANLRDLDLTTKHTFSYAAGDEIYLGWSRPFTAFRFDTGNANAVVRTMTISVGTGASTFTSVGAADTGFRDFTSLNGAPFGQSGFIVLMVDPVKSTGWIQNTVNGVTAYWMKISFSGALTASVTWLTAQIQPWYPSADSTNFPLDGLDKSGNFPHILFGRMSTSGEPIYHDMLSLPEPDNITQVVFGSGGGTNQNHSRLITMIGRFGTWVFSMGDNDRPGTEAAPFLNNVGLIEGASMIIAPGKVVRLKEVRIAGHEWDASVQGFFYYSYDWGKKWSRLGSRILTAPATLMNTSKQGMGSRFRWCFGFKQSAAGMTLSQPNVTEIEADFETVPGMRPSDLIERQMQSEPRF